MQRISAVDTFCELLVLALITQAMMSARAMEASARTPHHQKRRAIDGTAALEAPSNDRDIGLNADSFEFKLADVAADDMLNAGSESESVVSAVKSTKLLPQMSNNRADDYKSSGKLVLNRVEMDMGSAVKDDWTHMRDPKVATEASVGAAAAVDRTEQSNASDLETSATTEAKIFSHGNVEVVAQREHMKGLATGAINNGLDESAIEHKDESTLLQPNQADVSTTTVRATTEEILLEVERVAVKPSVIDGPSAGHTLGAEAAGLPQHSHENNVEDIEIRTLSTNQNKTLDSALNVATTTNHQPMTLSELIMSTTMAANARRLQESATESGTSTFSAGSSEKRAKFINDNSTNAQQMNLPNAAEVWTLAGLKTVPKTNHTEGSSEDNNVAAHQMQGNEITADTTTELNELNGTAVHSNSEKNLLDWTQIMMHGGFEGKRFENMIERSTTLHSPVDASQKQDDTLERVHTDTTPTNDIDTKSHAATALESEANTHHSVDVLLSSSTHLPDILNEVAQSHAQTTAAPTRHSMTMTSDATHLSTDNVDKHVEVASTSTEAPSLARNGTAGLTTEQSIIRESAGNVDSSSNGEPQTNVFVHNSNEFAAPTTTATPPTSTTTERTPTIPTTLPFEQKVTTIATAASVPPPTSPDAASDAVGDSVSAANTTTKAPSTSNDAGAVAEKVNNNNGVSGGALDDVTLQQRLASETTTTAATTTTKALAVSTLEASEASSVAIASAGRNNVSVSSQTGGIAQHEISSVASETTTESAAGSVTTNTSTVLPTKLDINASQPNTNSESANLGTITTTEANQFGNEVELEITTERITGSSTIKTPSTPPTITATAPTTETATVVSSSAGAAANDIDGHDTGTLATTNTTTASSKNELLIHATETGATSAATLTTIAIANSETNIDSTTSATPITTSGQLIAPETSTGAPTAFAIAEKAEDNTTTSTEATVTPAIRESLATTNIPFLKTTTTAVPLPTTGSLADVSSSTIAVVEQKTTKSTEKPPFDAGGSKPNEAANSGSTRDNESSIETNVIDQLERSSAKTPTSTASSVTTVTYKELANAPPTTEPTNAIGEVDTHNAPNLPGFVTATPTTTTTTTTTTMSANTTQHLAFVPLDTTTTTSTEPPLINLLDDNTTSTTTTTVPALPSTTISSTATKIQEVYSVFSSTSSATMHSESTSTSSTFASASTSSPPVSNTTTTPEIVTTTAAAATTTMLHTTTETILRGSIGGGGMSTGGMPTHLPTGIQHSNARNPGETDVNVIIAITVSVIGVIALILLVAFLYLIRKRQKQMSYGQRCRPVSLDAYSLDNVSVLGSVRRKGALRASKRSYGNIAFDDPSLRHNVLTAAELAQFVGRRSSIFEEFRDVPQITARADEVPQGCEDKNRYANVIPLPETRVILQQQNDDEKTEYINANYVRGPRDTPNYYIATQAPLETTVADFWRMIWEQQSRVIIQATDLIENGVEKCAEYLPPSVTLDNHATYGDFQITLKHREVKDKYAISTLMLKHIPDNEIRELTHYWYKWPETGVPSEEAPIIAMLLEARSSLKGYANEQRTMSASSATLRADSNSDLTSSVNSNMNGVTVISVEGGSTPERKEEAHSLHGNGNSAKANGNGEINGNLSPDKLKTSTTLRNQGPLTIHCSPGIGRTGTIIACDMAIRSLETPRRSVDIPQIVYYVRRGRASAVQTKEQYEFIYKVAHMYATKITNLSNDN